MGNKLIVRAFIETEKAKAWQFWIAKYMATNEFQPFNEFFESQKVEPTNYISKEQLLKEAQAIREKIEKGGG